MGEMAAMAVFLIVASVLFIKLVLLYKGSFITSLSRFVICLALIGLLYNALLRIGFPDSEFVVRDISRYGAGDYSFSLTGNQKYEFVHANSLIIEVRSDGRSETSVKLVKRTVIDIPSYAEAVLLVPNPETSKKYKQWLLESFDDPFAGFSYEIWEERNLSQNKSA
jgi:hypothetical protein